LARPPGFAHAVTAGNVVFLAGQTGLDPNGTIVPGGIVEQFRQALVNVLTALKAAGGHREHLASVTIYLVDIPDYQKHGREIGEIWRELAGSEYPAMAGIGITALWQPEALIEIQAIAVMPD
jgi:enamine deaminase RidA (YjgF/YER057c/UK114 family)